MLQVKTAEVSTCVDLYRIIYTCTIGLNFFFKSTHSYVKQILSSQELEKVIELMTSVRIVTLICLLTIAYALL